MRTYIIIAALCFVFTLNSFAQAPPPTPPNPVISSSNFCGHKTLARTTSPPLGIQWYWQSVQTGTDLNFGDPTYEAPQSGTYYLRAYRPSTGLWSTSSGLISVTVNPPPAVPPLPLSSDNSRVDVTILSNGMPPPFIRWCWQSSPDGTDMTNTKPSFTATSSGTFYYRAYDTKTGCWSAGASQITVKVNPLPASVHDKGIRENNQEKAGNK